MRILSLLEGWKNCIGRVCLGRRQWKQCIWDHFRQWIRGKVEAMDPRQEALDPRQWKQCIWGYFRQRQWIRGRRQWIQGNGSKAVDPRPRPPGSTASSYSIYTIAYFLFAYTHTIIHAYLPISSASCLCFITLFFAYFLMPMCHTLFSASCPCFNIHVSISII